MSDTPLFAIFLVHCFFAGKCKHTEQATDPQTAHDLMEAHYAAVHDQDIAEALRWMR